MPFDTRLALVLPALAASACAGPASRVEPTAPTRATSSSTASASSPSASIATIAPAEAITSAPAAASVASSAWPPRPPGVTTPFCLDGVVDALAEDACYVLPDAPTKTLLIYLPGLMSPSPDSSEKRIVETVVANAVRRAGIAALVPRGMTRAALVAPDKDTKGQGHYLSWPTGDEQYRKHAKELVARIGEKRRALEALVGAPFERVFLGGSSAGAFFVGHLMLRGDFPADGYLVISGGSGRPAPKLGELPKRPVYVGYGDGDTTGPKANEVAAIAKGAGWPVKVAMHHAGHGSREAYLDEAFELFGIAPRAASARAE